MPSKRPAVTIKSFCNIAVSKARFTFAAVGFSTFCWGKNEAKPMNEEQWLSCTDPIEMVEFLRKNPTSEDIATWRNARWRFEKASTGPDRKFRQFDCACCRRIWNQIPEPCNRDAVVAVEEFLDGQLPASALEAAIVASSAVEGKKDGSGRRSEPGYWAVKYLGRGFYKLTAAASALIVASKVMFMADEEYGREARHAFDFCLYTADGVFLWPFQWPLPVPATVQAERDTQAALLRCIFGNPFRAAPAIDPAWVAWNDGTVKKLAQAVYEQRALPQGTLDSARLAVLADALEEAGCSDEEILGHIRGPGPHVRGCWVVDLLLGKR
jgi:hypothetical protein